MLLYAVPFFVSGTILLTGALVGIRVTVPVDTGPPGVGSGGVGSGGVGSGGVGSGGVGSGGVGSGGVGSGGVGSGGVGSGGNGPVARSVTTTHFPFAAWSLTMVVLALASVGVGWLVATRFLRPLRAITATARDISASNLHRRLGPTGRADEFAELAATLDDLFARLQAAFTSQRRFVAHASHELRTPLAAQQAVLQVALADPDPAVDALRAACREVLVLGTAQEQLIASLLTLAGGQQDVDRREPFDLADLARQVLAGGPPDAPAGLTVVASLDPAPVRGDPRLVESLLANLVDNAMRHNHPGGDVEVMTSTSADGTPRLRVRNSGPVVPSTQVDRLFEPFQQLDGRRIRHAGGGHGLGLAIARAVADAHGATLHATARPTGGLDIEAAFPADDHPHAVPIDRYPR
ncbi:HAMP domain-containing sensor histidine kinase [Frankia sp. R82]|uniref:sensor histidine kinase n=1 Tax=Frankia sp. R82 TaxID=2950553 RepID=UPI002043806F|nr:HAMP domain-containing sensor histidine kinase [Frankia sp. R82]MCM3886865.1 HAMP domain-containing histidine kinase [Frankia sp. R82]